MKLQKRIISTLFAGLLVFGAAACNGDASDDATVDDTTTDTGDDTGTTGGDDLEIEATPTP